MTTAPKLQAILDRHKALAGRLHYSQGPGRLDFVHSGYTDCSGLESELFREQGLDIGTWTGNEITHGTLVTQSKSAARAGYGMLPGDLVFFAFGGNTISHVAMYAGGGKIWNHGGPNYNNMGPDLWSLQTNVDAAVRIEVRRMIAPAPGTVTHPPVTSATPGNPMHGKPIPALIARGTGDYFGTISGPNESHGGYYSSERPSIELIQEFCNWRLKSGLKVDGIFATATAAAVAKFQHAYMPGTQFYGQVWFDDWSKMASL